MEEEDRRRALLVRAFLCMLGLGLLVAADWCGSIVMSAGLMAGGPLISIAGNAAGVAVLVACAARPQRARGLCRSRAFLAGLAALLLVGRAADVFGMPLSGSLAVALAGSVLYQAAYAFTLLTWLSRCCAFEPRTSAVVVPGAYLVAAVLYFVIAAPPALAGSVVVCLLPAASGAVLLAACARDASEGDERVETRTQAEGWTFPLSPVVLMGAFKFAFYFSLSLTTGPSMFGPLGILVIAAFSVAYTAFAYDRFRASVLYKLALPCIVAGFVLLSWVDPGTPAATFLSNLGNISFELFIFISLAASCHRYRIEPRWMFGIVLATSTITSVAGVQAGNAFTAAYPAGSFESNLVMMTVVTALVALSIFFFDDHKAARAFGSQPVEPKDAGDGTVTTVMTYYEELVWRCDNLAREHGLSLREKEILALVAQGFSGARIEDELVISRNTVKTHMRHIYEKLGVHSRDEARALVEGVREP